MNYSDDTKEIMEILKQHPELSARLLMLALEATADVADQPEAPR